MISTDLGPNERLDDALSSLRIIWKPWRWKIDGSTIKAKKKLKKIFPKNDVVFFLTARAALHTLLRSLNLKKDDEVAIQGFTCEAVILPILSLSLKPVYIDINTDDFSMDFDSLKKRVSKKTKVIILQHTFGMTPLKRNFILKFAKRKNMHVIEDLAHGFNLKALRKDREQTIKLLSFGKTKAISSVFGGAVLTNRKKVLNKMKNLSRTMHYPSNYFILKMLLYKPLVILIKKTYSLRVGKIIHKICNAVGILPREISLKERWGRFDFFFVKKYPDALAYLLLRQIKKFDRIQEQRLKISSFYNSFFIKKSPNFSVYNDQYLSRYPLLIKSRDNFLNRLSNLEVYLGRWYDNVVAPKTLDLSRLKYVQGSCPKAEDATTKIINLPTNITLREAKRIIKYLAKARLA